MNEFTMVLPYFSNRGMVAEQQKIWADYPKKLRERLHVVIVDDCSPKEDRLSTNDIWITGLGSLRVYRLLKKKRWNWPAARNLGAIKACTDWLLLTDIDHAMPVDTLEYLIGEDLDQRQAYKFKRVDPPHRWPYQMAECKPYKAHNDSWFMTRQLFFYDDGMDRFVQGYDERLSGCYGTSGEFTDRVEAIAPVTTLHQYLIRYGREIIPDASTLPSVYTRKNDPQNDKDLEKRKARRATLGNWRPLRGLIGFEPVYIQQEIAA